jgi:hypothetical protein
VLARAPWWVQVLLVYGAARLVSAVVFLAVARTQEANLWTPAAPSYPEYTGRMWDADWYRGIAEDGYPVGLPRNADGSVPQNAWAFFPLFPALVRGLTTAGIPWQVAGPTLALLLGAVAMLVVYRVVESAVRLYGTAAPADPATDSPLDAGAAWAARLPLATVAVLATFASAPVLQVAYTESLALLLLAATLWCLMQRWYLPAIPLVLALGLTRAVALPVAVAVVAHAVGLRRRPADDAPQDRAGWRILLLLGTSIVAGLLWPLLVAARTGELLAYQLTQGAWRGRGEVVPVVPWIDVARWLFGQPGLLVLAGLLAAAVLIVVATRRFGPELQWWTAGYLAYLFVAVEPGTSLVRFGLLAFPIAAVVARWALRRRWWRAALTGVLLLGVAGQIGWVGLLWRLVPPSGWPP